MQQMTDPMGRRYNVWPYELHPGHWEYRIGFKGQYWDSIDIDNGVPMQWPGDRDDCYARAQAMLNEFDTNAAFNDFWQDNGFDTYWKVWGEFRRRAMKTYAWQNLDTEFARLFLTGKYVIGYGLYSSIDPDYLVHLHNKGELTK